MKNEKEIHILLFDIYQFIIVKLNSMFIITIVFEYTKKKKLTSGIFMYMY